MSDLEEFAAVLERRVAALEADEPAGTPAEEKKPAPPAACTPSP